MLFTTKHFATLCFQLATMTEDEQAEVKLQKVLENKDELKDFAKITDVEDVESWLRMNSHMLSEDSASMPSLAQG